MIANIAIKNTVKRYLTYAAVAAMAATAGMALHLKSQRDQARADLSEHQRVMEEAKTKAVEKAREQETAMRADADKLRNALAKEKQHAKEAQSRLVAGIRNGTERLSIAAQCPSQTGPDSAIAGGGGSEGARAELDPSAAEALVAIAADGDEAIRERNACIAAYENVRATLNQ